jgi:hypothetical protein
MGIRDEDVIFITETGAEGMTKWTGTPEVPAVARRSRPASRRDSSPRSGYLVPAAAGENRRFGRRSFIAGITPHVDATRGIEAVLDQEAAGACGARRRPGARCRRSLPESRPQASAVSSGVTPAWRAACSIASAAPWKGACSRGPAAAGPTLPTCIRGCSEGVRTG